MPETMFRAVLFDLDGTLLKVAMHRFIPRYVAGFHARCADLVAFEPLQRAMRAGIHLLLEVEDGRQRNDVRFFNHLAQNLHLDIHLLRERYSRFLDKDLEQLADAIQPIPEARALVEHCHKARIPLALATNPVFPQALIEARCRWAGLDVELFTLVTSFENSRYCKPQRGYFDEVADKLGVDPCHCLMVGNDSCHDLSASVAGMTTWLLEPFLMERDGPKWEPHYRGDHQQLLDFLRVKLPV